MSSAEAICNTYYFGTIFQMVTMLVTLIPNMICSCLGSGPKDMVTISKNWYVLSYFAALVNFTVFAFRVIHNMSFYNLYELANASIPSSGWYVDYVVLWLVTVIAYYRIKSLYSISCVDDEGKLFKMSKKLAYLDVIGGPAMMLAHMTWLTANAKPRSATNGSRMAFVVLYLLICLKELRMWVPLVRKWDVNHCFLDGFMGTDNEANLYITVSIILVNMVSCWVFWETNIRSNPLLAIIMIILAFYNATIAIAVYLIWTEISGDISSVCLKKMWSRHSMTTIATLSLIACWVCLAPYWIYRYVAKYYL